SRPPPSRPVSCPPNTAKRMSTTPSIGLARRCGRVSVRGATLLLLLASAACVRREPPLAPAPEAGRALPRAEPTVRVGLLVDTSAAEIGGTRGVELSTPSGGRLRRVQAGGSATVSADGVGRLRVGGEPVAAPEGMLIARAADGGAVSVNVRPYRGELLLRADGPGRLAVVNRVDLEAYLLGVVPREIGRVGPERFEAAKAQAVAARTYAVRYLGRRESLGFDVFASVEDQVYGGMSDEYDLVSRAVRETEGEILVYGGQPIEAYYHSTCGGHTAAIEEVWDADPVPYLRAVRDIDPRTGQAYDHFSSRFRWTQRWSASDLNRILAQTLADSIPDGASGVGELRDIRILERTASGRIRR